VEPAGNVNSRLGEHFDFVDQGLGIDDDARADDGVARRAQDAARNELEDEAIAIEDDGVASVVSAGAARDVVKRTGKIVNDLAFAFVAPLRADHDD